MGVMHIVVLFIRGMLRNRAELAAENLVSLPKTSSRVVSMGEALVPRSSGQARYRQESRRPTAVGGNTRVSRRFAKTRTRVHALRRTGATSRCLAIPMMQAADLRNGDHSATAWRFDFTLDRRVSGQRQVRAGVMIIVEV